MLFLPKKKEFAQCTPLFINFEALKMFKLTQVTDNFR